MLQLEEERGARERAVGGGELEVPCCSLSPRPAEFQMGRPLCDREPLVLAIGLLCGPASVFTI